MARDEVAPRPGLPGVRETLSVVQLPSLIVDELLRRAQASPEEEICGLISRDRRGFRKCYPVPNQAGDKQRFFALDPKA